MVKLDRRAKHYLLVSLENNAIHAIEVQLDKVICIRLYLMFKKARAK